MKKIRHSRLLVIGVVCGNMIALFAYAQRKDEKAPQDPPSGFALKFERMGGYAGVHDEFWIYPDGRVLKASGKRAKILPGTVEKWMQKFSSVTASKPTSGIALQSLCMDCFVYHLTVYDKGGARKLVLSSPLDSAPDTLEAELENMRDQLLRLSWN